MGTANEDVDGGQREPSDPPIVSTSPPDPGPAHEAGALPPSDSDEHETGEAQAARNRADESPA